ncbi:DUF998 domain-containing protein [Demequina rhizosphaerae]|uniref:DUF998 domain-containing protein n=1 Tax=Demequina rhizosphaerae TaxID=1638985 RepID=UPI0007832653|nr:DUF998 domain-containing protein [Demequina rhizosphaerae]
MGEGARRGLAAVAAAAPVAFVALTRALGAAWDGYDPVRDTQSELGAVDSPVRWAMNLGGFVVLGLGILAFAAAYRATFAGAAATVAVVLIVVAGAGMVVVGFLPCDAGCVDTTVTGRLHSWFSAPGAIGLPAAAMVTARVAAVDGRMRRRWSGWSFGIGLASLASGPVVAAGLLPEADGLLQRVGMWLALGWMSVFAWTMRGLAPRADATRPRPPAR